LTRYEIFQAVEAENARSKAKYGMWGNLADVEHKDAIVGEHNEWLDAYYSGDIHGEHGELREAIQTINVLCRRIQFLTGEADA
jgi:hypothetical protein